MERRSEVISLFFVDRTDPDARPALVTAASHWVSQYNQGETDFCFCCGRRLALPEPPPRYHVFIGLVFSADAACGTTGGICDACAQKGDEHCYAGVSAYVPSRLGIDLQCIARPHQIHQPAHA